MKTAQIIVLVVLGSSTLGDENQPREVLSENPNVTAKLSRDWNQEFFQKSRSVEPSYFEELGTSFGSQLNSESRIGRTSRQNPSRSYRINTRHYDTLPDGNSQKVKMENLEWMLQKIFVYPRSHVTNETAKEMIRNYISDSFQLTSGLHTSVQHFRPLQFLSMYEGQSIPTGANIIAVLKGTEWATPNDKPTVIGAHWDTVNFTPGTDDNGSGVASMLEAARAIAHSACRPKYSIIFVAFDLEEVGSQGSLVFIKDYLMKVLETSLPAKVKANNFQGAFIMDTIMNFNQSEGSQTFPTDWSLVLPDVYEEVANENYVGDFLSMIYRRDVDFEMARTFRTQWDKSSHDSKYKIKEFPLILKEDLPDLETLSDHLNFLRSDHARFWFMNDTEIPFTLNAVLMTDTGPYRGDMRMCYHTVCDGPEINIYNRPDNLKFLAKITQALADTAIAMSECKVHDARNTQEFTNTNNIVDNIQKKIGAVNNASQRNLSLLRSLVDLFKWVQKF